MQRPLAATCFAAALALTTPGEALAQANPLLLLTKVNGVVCSQISQVACWSTLGGVPAGRLPNADEWAMLGGDNASQAAGQSHQFAIVSVIWLPSFIGSVAFPSHFTQYGTMHSGVLSVDDGSYTVGAGQGTFVQLNVGADPLQGARPDRSLRNPLLEVRGGSVTTSRLKVGSDAFGQDSRSSGEIRLTGGRLQVFGDLSGAGISPLFVSSKLFIDGGQLEAPRITHFSELLVGSAAGRIGSLRRGAGETASTGLLAIGVDGGTGTVQLAGVGAAVTASRALVGSGQGGRGTMNLLAGSLAAGSVTLAQGADSYGSLTVEGPGSTVAVTGDMDIGAGGRGQLIATGGSRISSADVRVGNVSGGSGFVDLALPGTHLETRDFSLGAEAAGELHVAESASLTARNLVVGQYGTMTLRNGGVQADTMRVDAGGLVAIRLTSADPFFETGFLMVNGPLHFEGRLQLSFLDGFAPEAGRRLQLFSFDGFSGLLGADQVTVNGFDAGMLDFGMLSVDGSIRVAPVPEPAIWLLWGVGALVLAARRRLQRA